MTTVLKVILDQLVDVVDADAAEASLEVARALVSTAPARCEVAGVVPADGVAALALAAGYCDQAHLIREFRELAGETPGRFASERHELSDLFTGRPRPPASDPAPHE